MLRIIKPLISALVIVALFVGTTSNAQSTSLSQKAKNIGQVLLMQFDVTDILEDFKADLLINDNSCKQLDRFQILSAQSAIVDDLLLNFETITSDQRQVMIQNYQSLEVELEFVKNLNILIKNGFEEGRSAHLKAVQNSLPSDLSDEAASFYNSFALKYEDRVRVPDPSNPNAYLEGAYTNCPTSWSSIKERAFKIEQEVQKIGEEWNSLKSAATKFKNSSKDAISPSNLKNLLIEKPIQGVKKSFQSSLNDFKYEFQKNKKEFIAISSDPIQTYQQIRNENERILANRTDIAGLLLESQDITQISQSLAEKAQIRQLLESKVQNYATNQITSQHFDLGLQANFNLAFQTPLLVSYNKQVFKKTNEDGLLKLSKQVYDRQCVINP
jgi:hypothetical protein